MSSWTGALRHLSFRELCETVLALGVACLVEIALRTSRLPSVATAFGCPLDTRNSTSPQVFEERRGHLTPRERRRLAAARRVSRHWPLGDTCLRVSLVSGFLLRHRNPVLRVGVARLDGEVKAHAWIEMDGIPLDASGAAQYFVLSGGTP